MIYYLLAPFALLTYYLIGWHTIKSVFPTKSWALSDELEFHIFGSFIWPVLYAFKAILFLGKIIGKPLFFPQIYVIKFRQWQIKKAKEKQIVESKPKTPLELLKEEQKTLQEKLLIIEQKIAAQTHPYK